MDKRLDDSADALVLVDTPRASDQSGCSPPAEFVGVDADSRQQWRSGKINRLKGSGLWGIELIGLLNSKDWCIFTGIIMGLPVVI